MSYLAERSELARRRLVLHGSRASTSVPGWTDNFKSLEVSLAVRFRFRRVSDESYSLKPLIVKRWEQSLPSRLRLTRENLESHAANAEFGDSTTSWAFSLMHTLRCCSVLALHAVGIFPHISPGQAVAHNTFRRSRRTTTRNRAKITLLNIKEHTKHCCRSLFA